MPLARPFSSKPLAKRIFPISCMHFCNTSTGNSFHQRWRAGRIGVPNKNRFRPCGASFNPARALLYVPFYWKGDLVPRFRREQTHQHIGAENSRCWCRLSATTPIPFGRRGWDAGSTPVSDQSTRFSPDQCFHVISVHIERGFVFLIRREQNHRTTGFRPTVADATCCCCGGQTSPEDARTGRRIDEFRLVFISVPVARSDHCSYRCGYTTFFLPS